MRWNHNIHFHDAVQRSIPPPRRRLMWDAGRGRHSEEVLAIDTEPECLAFARAASGRQPNLTFLQGDVLD